MTGGTVTTDTCGRGACIKPDGEPLKREALSEADTLDYTAQKRVVGCDDVLRGRGRA